MNKQSKKLYIIYIILYNTIDFMKKFMKNFRKKIQKLKKKSIIR